MGLDILYTKKNGKVVYKAKKEVFYKHTGTGVTEAASPHDADAIKAYEENPAYCKIGAVDINARIKNAAKTVAEKTADNLPKVKAKATSKKTKK